MSKAPIYVTKPSLPPLEEFIPYLEKIWQNNILTNCGPFHEELEQALCEYLGVKHISLFANGTLALMTALQASNLRGEVITTPYSFVATTHALMWNGLSPVFVDIDPETLNLDAAKIEAAITPETTGILPVHCYGNPCDVEAIKHVADKYNLKVIYDAAHAFGVRDQGGSILRHGDFSVLSFHATKVFNTLEGGAIISPDSDAKRRVDQLKNFGIHNEFEVNSIGLNGKLNEVSAAFGLLQLRSIDEVIRLRKVNDGIYRKSISNIKGLRPIERKSNTIANYSYFPVLVGKEFPLSRDDLYKRLTDQNIFPRRYFYPLISDFDVYKMNPSINRRDLDVAGQVASEILCLPIYPSLLPEEVNTITELLKQCSRG